MGLERSRSHFPRETNACPPARYALDSGGALRVPFQQFRPDFRAATRPMSSHGRHVTKAFHSNSGVVPKGERV